MNVPDDTCPNRKSSVEMKGFIEYVPWFAPKALDGWASRRFLLLMIVDSLDIDIAWMTFQENLLSSSTPKKRSFKAELKWGGTLTKKKETIKKTKQNTKKRSKTKKEMSFNREWLNSLRRYTGDVFRETDDFRWPHIEQPRYPRRPLNIEVEILRDDRTAERRRRGRLCKCIFAMFRSFVRRWGRLAFRWFVG